MAARRFEGQVAVVTGAASGIGAATARRLASEGAALVLLDVSAAGLADVAADCGGELFTAVVDVSDASAVAQVLARAQQQFPVIDVLCNNAGVAGGDYSPVTANDTALWERLYRINVLGAVHCIQQLAPAMQARGKGAIVNTASVAGLRSGAGGNAYSASKAALISLTQTAACDLGADGVRVNAVCPGLVRTGMTQAVFDRAEQLGKQDRLGARCELRRPGEPNEVAAVIAFLASDDASFVTGQALAVDGGNTASLNMPGMKV
ncbi:SDR family NAD(P)-dependent oxidoreductase [Isoalcanivorax beigongshangi]|uniref:SDR family NAD(P)-dependent oxidoreductase n=1 Tax=Isoalcanivorax beigongshangi TaxID=3238810 RepID=A0ABV4AH29_9GAMM